MHVIEGGIINGEERVYSWFCGGRRQKSRLDTIAQKDVGHLIGSYIT